MVQSSDPGLSSSGNQKTGQELGFSQGLVQRSAVLLLQRGASKAIGSREPVGSWEKVLLDPKSGHVVRGRKADLNGAYQVTSLLHIDLLPVCSLDPGTVPRLSSPQTWRTSSTGATSLPAASMTLLTFAAKPTTSFASTPTSSSTFWAW